MKRLLFLCGIFVQSFLKANGGVSEFRHTLSKKLLQQGQRMLELTKVIDHQKLMILAVQKQLESRNHQCQSLFQECQSELVELDTFNKDTNEKVDLIIAQIQSGTATLQDCKNIVDQLEEQRRKKIALTRKQNQIRQEHDALKEAIKEKRLVEEEVHRLESQLKLQRLKISQLLKMFVLQQEEMLSAIKFVLTQGIEEQESLLERQSKKLETCLEQLRKLQRVPQPLEEELQQDEEQEEELSEGIEAEGTAAVISRLKKRLMKLYRKGESKARLQQQEQQQQEQQQQEQQQQEEESQQLRPQGNNGGLLGWLSQHRLVAGAVAALSVVELAHAMHRRGNLRQMARDWRNAARNLGALLSARSNAVGRLG